MTRRNSDGKFLRSWGEGVDIGIYRLMGLGRSPGAVTGLLTYRPTATNIGTLTTSASSAPICGKAA